jgi:hypothetical protein
LLLGIAPQILTSTTSESPPSNPRISEEDKKYLLAALTTLGGPKSKMLRGTWFPGQPTGGLEFAKTCLNDKSTDHAQATARPLNRLTNTQTQKEACCRALHSTHKQTKRDTLTPTFPPHMPWIILPQLLNKTTGFPFHSLSRQQPDHRISPATFTIALKRKLCLSITDPAQALLECPCGKAPDVFRDHFFHCKSAPGHKTAPRDKMRDTLLFMFRSLGPLTEWTGHECDVACEQAKLLNMHPGNGPADVGIALQPQPSPAHETPHSCLLAVDFAITPAPKLP